jgi:hypothetical protein
MRLPSRQVEPEPLAALADEVAQRLFAGKYADLAARFGYAVALGREPAAAIRDDLRSCLAELGESALQPDVPPEVRLSYFGPDGPLKAVAECVLFALNGVRVLVEVVVSEANGELHATLEDISANA